MSMENQSAQEMVRILKSRGMSQVRIAAALNVSEAEVSRWVNGKVKPNGEATLKIIAYFQAKTGGLAVRQGEEYDRVKQGLSESVAHALSECERKSVDGVV